MRLFISLFFPLAILVLPINSSASDIKCAIEKYRRYATAQQEWQRTSTDLIVNANSKFKNIAILDRDIQLYSIEMKLIETEYMVANAPDRVRFEAVLNGWFTLNDDDKIKIAKSNPRYTDLSNLLQTTSSSINNPDIVALRPQMQNQISTMSDYQSLLRSTSTTMVKINSILCSK